MSRPVLGVQSDQAPAAVSLADVPSEGGGAQVDGVVYPGCRAGAARDVLEQLAALRLLLKPKLSLVRDLSHLRSHFKLIFFSL